MTRVRRAGQPAHRGGARRAVEVAVTRRDRARVCSADADFEASSALIIAPCFSIHTMFMRFDIDAVFVDEEGRAVKVVRELRPWRIAVDPSAHAVVELPAGRLRDREVNVGDPLYLVERGGKRIGLSVQIAGAGVREPACPQPDAVLEPEQQYAVVLLNEEQLGQFMRKPGIRLVNRGYAVPDVHTRYRALKRRTAAAAAVLLVARRPAASCTSWRRSPRWPRCLRGRKCPRPPRSIPAPASASPFRRPIAATAPATPPGACATSGSPRSHASRRAAASCIRRWSVRMRRSTRPSACSAGWRVGFAAAGMFVDETLRNAPRKSSRPMPPAMAIPTILLLGAPDRLSVVFEMPLEPRQVRSRRVENVLDLDVGRCRQIEPQQWSAPEGVHLLRARLDRRCAGVGDGASSCARTSRCRSSRAPTCAPRAVASTSI